MAYRPEPAYRHGQPASHAGTAVVLVNLGTPDEPTPPAVRRYLAEFLSDPRVVEIPRAAWWPILHGVILRTRPSRSAAKYASVWSPQGSPLAVWSARQALLLGQRLTGDGLSVPVVHAMRYGNPSLPAVLDALRAQDIVRMLVLPLYPQYAGATTGSVHDRLAQWAGEARRVPALRFVAEYHDDPGYIDALAQRLQAHWAAQPRGERLVLSFHGVPERSLRLGDPYHCQCHKTARLLRERLALPEAAVAVTFQSRFGRARWLEPYTEPTLVALAQQGVRRVDVMCPGFVADCLETLEEIAQEARDAFVAAGGETFAYVPCLNDSTPWIDALAAIVRRELQGWPSAVPTAADAAERARQRERALALGSPD